MTRALILAGGRLGEFESGQEKPALVIAADGGLAHAFALGLTVDVVIGDFDSAPNELVQLAVRHGSQLIHHPADKDRTDLELALDLARERKATEVTILGGFGGRIDHELANLLLPSRASYDGMRITFVASGCSAMVVTVRTVIAGEPGDIVTILPIGPPPSGITTSGLEYPLVDESLEPGSSRGVSNVMTHSRAVIEIERGQLLVLHLARGRGEVG